MDKGLRSGQDTCICLSPRSAHSLSLQPSMAYFSRRPRKIDDNVDFISIFSSISPFVRELFRVGRSRYLRGTKGLKINRAAGEARRWTRISNSAISIKIPQWDRPLWAAQFASNILTAATLRTFFWDIYFVAAAHVGFRKIFMKPDPGLNWKIYIIILFRILLTCI